MQILEQLKEIRSFGGKAVTTGLSDKIILAMANSHATLPLAVDAALSQFRKLKQEFPEILALDETEQIKEIQAGYTNFYADDAINPYVSLAANGPWLITTKGAVIHDSGGYGMLGFGHSPTHILAAMNREQVMANVMTANFSQLRLQQALEAEIGHTRDGGNPFCKYLCLNSGSEAVTVATRISDINAKQMTDEPGKHAGKLIKVLGLSGAFHGRTDRPAQFSDSTHKTYKKHLASFRDRDNLLTVAPNNITALRNVFQAAEADNQFIEAMFIEPVMGEGNPGMAMTPAFYRAARELTQQHDCLLLVDSIQAGLRVQGCLSIVDYPGFQDCEAPDMETYSKALNGGQYPLSVLAMNEKATALYAKGVYGNTMTTNPRALDVAVAVLGSITPEMRENIVSKGVEFVEKFEALAKQLDGRITAVQGTGLLFSCELSPAFKSCGVNSTEDYMRKKGIGVIHGGKNSLRFTPHFGICSDEVDLMVEATRQALLHGPSVN